MEPVQTQSDRLAAMLTVGAVLTILTGLALGLFVTPFGYIAVVVGLLDFVWIALIRAGRVGPAAGAQAERGEATLPAEPDPAANPYARED
jgi:hypothetical protein